MIDLLYVLAVPVMVLIAVTKAAVDWREEEKRREV